MRLCSIEGCGKPHCAKGLCRKCYYAAKYVAERNETKERNRRWRRDNPDKIKDQHRRWRSANPHKSAEYSRRYKQKNPDKAKARADKYQKENCQKLLERARQWKRAHPDVQRAWEHRRRSRELDAVGYYTPEEWSDRVAEYGGICPRCRTPWTRPTVDHIVPLSKGGTNWIWNIQPLCGSCNSAKKDRHCTYYPPPIHSA